MKTVDVSENSVFNLINLMSRVSDRIDKIREINEENVPSEILGYLDEAKMYAGGVYVALNNYVDELTKEGIK